MTTSTHTHTKSPDLCVKTENHRVIFTAGASSITKLCRRRKKKIKSCVQPLSLSAELLGVHVKGFVLSNGSRKAAGFLQSSHISAESPTAMMRGPVAGGPPTAPAERAEVNRHSWPRSSADSLPAVHVSCASSARWSRRPSASSIRSSLQSAAAQSFPSVT